MNLQQPSVNIGLIGHVSHGKTTVVKCITDKDTKQSSKEQKTNKTIHLGYANAKIFKCKTCPSPEAYQSTNKDSKNCIHCGEEMDVVRHVSFVDCPGHNMLMATMLNGACIMDTSILVVSAYDSIIPAPQTEEHIIAAEIMGLDNLCICYNKVDLVSQKIAQTRSLELKKYVKNTSFEKSPIIPISANFNINIDSVCQYIAEEIPEPKRNLDADAKVVIVRSFNINKPQVSIEELQGGVVGGSIIEGVLNIDSKITIIPGLMVANKDDSTLFSYKPITSTVKEIFTEKTKLDCGKPGGLIGIKLTVDPSLTLQDKLIGNLLIEGSVDKYKIYEIFTIEYKLIKLSSTKHKIHVGDVFIINCNAKNTRCEVLKKEKHRIQLKVLSGPICTEIGGKVAISKKSGSSGAHLIGVGYIQDDSENKESKRLI
jgi:translation initiation factor 2 subunit 3